MEKIVLPLGVIMLAAIMVGLFFGLPFLGYAMYQDLKSPTFELRKDSWSCSEFYRYTSTTYIQSGKVLVPVTSQHKDCVNYRKVK